jgi:hypothetical protein
VEGSCVDVVVYTFSGVASDVPVGSLSGWTQCYVGPYDATVSLATLLAQCDQANLLMACRETGSATLTLAAHAPRADVTFDTGAANVTHAANGVGWYYSTNWSWGFAVAGDAVDRDSCDVLSQPNGDKRMCWHTGSGNLSGGYRCGTATGLNASTAYERLVFQAP